jgi:hypothetical protein
MNPRGKQIQMTNVYTNTRMMIYIGLLPIVELLEETRGGGKEENDIVDSIETHGICVGARHKETH